MPTFENPRLLLVLVPAVFSFVACAPAHTRVDAPRREPVAWQVGEDRPTINVDARGEVRVAPDRATVEIAVESRAPTAEDAVEENARRTRDLLSALAEMDIPEEAIETRRFAVHPEYRRDPEEEPRTVAYRAVNVLSVQVDDLQRVGPVIDGAVRAGADRVSRIQLEVSEPEAVRAAALRRAVENGRLAAAALAEALEVSLGPIVEVTTVDAPVVPFRTMAMEAEPRPDTPILPPEQTVTATIRLVYEIR